MKKEKFIMIVIMNSDATAANIKAVVESIQSVGLEAKIMEYGEYIKLIIFALVAIAIVYFIAKWWMGRNKK